MIKERDIMITQLKDEIKLLNANLPDVLAQQRPNSDILIDISKDGSYHIKEWDDPNAEYELDGLIFEIFKNE